MYVCPCVTIRVAMHAHTRAYAYVSLHALYTCTRTYYVRRPCPLPDMTARDAFFRTIIVCGLAMVVTVQAFSNNAYPMVTRHVRRNVGDVPVALFTHRPMLLIKLVAPSFARHRRIPRNEKSVRCSSRVLVEIPVNYGPAVGGRCY